MKPGPNGPATSLDRHRESPRDRHTPRHMAFLQEPSHSHDRHAQCGVLLVNLGTPDAPTPSALRRYLAQFLSDPRVVEIPKAVWSLILHGIILRVRPAKSARKYASIWTADGSPLATWTEKQAKRLQGDLGERGLRMPVKWAMRYGQPSIAQQMAQFKQEGIDRVLILPAYPQYSGATTASVFDDVARFGQQTRYLPELRFVNHYHDHPSYIAALATKVRAHWQRDGRAEHLVLSFHGMPHRTLMLGDPYHCHCHKTARLLADALGLTREQYSVTFQSRFGRAKWLEPYTEPTVVALAKKGVKSVQVFCPGFVADCLETLEEIAMEVKEAYLTAGGERFDYIPALNDEPSFIAALADIADTHTGGWPRTSEQLDMLRAQAHARLARARDMGAAQ